MALATRVIDFSTGQTLAASGVVVFLDPDNVDDEGNAITGFAPGDTIWLLATVPAEYRFVSAAATDGVITHHGLVARSQTDQILFAALNEDQGLSQMPTSEPTVAWYGTVGSIQTDMEMATISAAAGSLLPCLGDATYAYQAESISLATDSMALADGETYPYGIVVYVEKA